MPSPSTYPKNAWYVAALSREVDGEGLFHRRILSTSVVLYRDTAGGLVALHDRCPHRFAPLSMGRHDGNDVICPYHGLRFNSEGRCVHNPHGKGHIPPAAAVRRFPAAERQGLIWIWMGDGPADQDALPDFAPLAQGHANGLGLTYMKLPVNYRMILDNVMDLSHVDYVHGEIISTRGQLSPLFPKVEDSDRHVSARWEWTQTPPMLIFNQFLPRPEDAAEHFVQVSWSAPANIQLSVGAVQDGKPFEEGASQYDLHCCTPEDEGSTHYFFATRRDHIEDDGEYNAFKIKAMHDAFELEDGPIIAAAEREMGGEDFFDLNPVLMSNDLAPVKVRRALQKLVAAEYHGGDVPESGVKDARPSASRKPRMMSSGPSAISSPDPDALPLAIVVGAGGSFGTAIVAALVEAGQRVIGVGRDASAMAHLVERHGMAFRAVAADIASDDAVAAIGAEITGPVSMVVHAPGVPVAGGIRTAPTAALVEACNIKVGGFVRLIRAAEPFLRQGSRLVAVGGHYGFEPTAYAATAGIANAAIASAVKQLSWAYGELGITAHLVAPGPADTARLHGIAAGRAKQLGVTEAEVLADMRSESAIGAFATPEQVAWAIALLLDPRADAMAGSTIMVDAGRRRAIA